MKKLLTRAVCGIASAMLAGICAVPVGADKLEFVNEGAHEDFEKSSWDTFGFCGSPRYGGVDSETASISWGIDTITGTLTIIGKGSMYPYSNNPFNRGWMGGPYWDSPWAGNPEIRKVVISDGITTIGYGAFAGCENLTEIEVPDSVVYIEGDAFWNTAWYKNQPDGMVYIGNVLYAYKGSLPEKTEITVKDGTLSICETAFVGDDYDFFTNEGYLKEKISGYYLPESMLNYGSSYGNAIDLRESEWYQSQPDGLVFLDHTAVSIKGDIPESITFPEGTVGISDRFIDWDQFGYGHSDASTLKTVTFPESVQYIGYYAFSDCENLSSVTIENPDCIINDSLPVFYQDSLDPFTYTFNGTIYGYAGSTAEAYARKHELKFRIIGTDEGFDPEDIGHTGDFTEDGIVSVDDAQMTLRLYTETNVAGKEVRISEEQMKMADINKDGKVTVEDAQYILIYYTENSVAGLDTDWADILNRIQK